MERLKEETCETYFLQDNNKNPVMEDPQIMDPYLNMRVFVSMNLNSFSSNL